MSPYESDKSDLQKDYAEVFVSFCKVLKELKLDFNIGVFITGADTLYEQNKLDNLIYILRSASLFLPNFLKVVLTIEKKASNP
jgi:hypothetical protein